MVNTENVSTLGRGEISHIGLGGWGKTSKEKLANLSIRIFKGLRIAEVRLNFNFKFKRKVRSLERKVSYDKRRKIKKLRQRKDRKITSPQINRHTSGNISNSNEPLREHTILVHKPKINNEKPNIVEQLSKIFVEV